MTGLTVDMVIPAACFGVVVLIVGYAWLVEHGASVLARARERLAAEPDRELVALVDAATPLWLELEQLAPWPSREASTRTAGVGQTPAVEGPRADQEESPWVRRS